MVVVHVVEDARHGLERRSDALIRPGHRACPDAAIVLGPEVAEEDLLEEVERCPAVLVAEGQGRHASGLERVSGSKELVPRRGCSKLVGVEERLVEPQDAVALDVDRHGIWLALVADEIDDAGRELVGQTEPFV